MAAQQHEILVLARYEREERRAAEQDTVWLDELIVGLEKAQGNLHDVEILRAIRAVVERHG
ncbi:MAG: hypothetical protein ACRDRP_18215 [Pseudonocardiaceae bacterium]